MGNAQRKETPSLDWTLGDRLGKSLKFAGVSAQDMAEYLGVARNTVSNYLNDHTNPSKLARKEWAFRTGVTVAWLETGVEGDDNGTDPRVTGLKHSTLAPVTGLFDRLKVA